MLETIHGTVRLSKSRFAPVNAITVIIIIIIIIIIVIVVVVTLKAAVRRLLESQIAAFSPIAVIIIIIIIIISVIVVVVVTWKAADKRCYLTQLHYTDFGLIGSATDLTK